MEEFLRVFKGGQPIENVTEEEYKLIDSFCECHTADELIKARNDFVAYVNLGLRIAMRAVAEGTVSGQKKKEEKASSDFHKREAKGDDEQRAVQNTLF
jgi:hypothetical protein